MSPINGVLGTYELLEPILLHLTPRELFKAQRVNTTWNAVILRSQAIQRRMFLAPSQDCLEPVFNDSRNWPPEYEQDVQILTGLRVIHSRHRRRCRHAHYPPSREYALHKLGVFDPTTDAAVAFQSTRKYEIKNYSYRTMFITQPPVTTVGIVVESVAKSDKDWMTPICNVRNATGVTIMDVCRAVGAVSQSHKVATGEHIPPGRFGFVLIDPVVPDARRARLKGGRRYASCQACERARQEKASASEQVGAAQV